ncbi:MAG: hypothetical protein NTW86_31765 [Candidatus Sumerlaeota bacterium]|nr:hypothetical protein [Candidatus Sumerlaeota bacterium]
MTGGLIRAIVVSDDAFTEGECLSPNTFRVRRYADPKAAGARDVNRPAEPRLMRRNRLETILSLAYGPWGAWRPGRVRPHHGARKALVKDVAASPPRDAPGSSFGL